MVDKSLLPIRTRVRQTKSSSQLIMLNRIVTRFLLFLNVLEELLRPVAFLSCKFLKLYKEIDYLPLLLDRERLLLKEQFF